MLEKVGIREALRRSGVLVRGSFWRIFGILLLAAVIAQVIGSVLQVPFLADLLALRRVPAHSFGIFMSLSPVFAAAIGATFLGEGLAVVDWLAIGLIVGTNAVAVIVTPPTATAPLGEGDRVLVTT